MRGRVDEEIMCLAVDDNHDEPLLQCEKTVSVKAVFHSNCATIWRHRRRKIRALLTTFAGRHRAPSKINTHWCGKFDGWTISWLRRNEDFFFGRLWPTLVRNLLFNERENSSPVPNSESKLEHHWDRCWYRRFINTFTSLKVGGPKWYPQMRSHSIWSDSRWEQRVSKISHSFRIRSVIFHRRNAYSISSTISSPASGVKIDFSRVTAVLLASLLLAATARRHPNKKHLQFLSRDKRRESSTASMAKVICGHAANWGDQRQTPHRLFNQQQKSPHFEIRLSQSPLARHPARRDSRSNRYFHSIKNHRSLIGNTESVGNAEASNWWGHSLQSSNPMWLSITSNSTPI